jgi:ATP-dependent DNA helicase RecG
MNPEELGALLSSRESVTVEVKSDTGPLSEAELLEAVVCLANAQGGT